MGTALQLNKKQMFILLLVLLSLLVTAFIVLHAATPNVFHTFAYTPKFFNRH